MKERCGDGLAPSQVFHAVPSSPFSAPAYSRGGMSPRIDDPVLIIACIFSLPSSNILGARRDWVPSEGDSGRLNLPWSLRPSPHLSGPKFHVKKKLRLYKRRRI